MVAVDPGPPVAGVVGGKIAGDIHQMRLSRRGQRASWNAVADMGLTCPPEQFVSVRGVVEALCLTSSGGGRQRGSSTVVDYVKVGDRAGYDGAERLLQFNPRLRRCKREPVRSALRNRLGQGMFVLACRLRLAECD
jgi:hypothetical protein